MDDAFPHDFILIEDAPKDSRPPVFRKAKTRKKRGPIRSILTGLLITSAIAGTLFYLNNPFSQKPLNLPEKETPQKIEYLNIPGTKTFSLVPLAYDGKTWRADENSTRTTTFDLSYSPNILKLGKIEYHVLDNDSLTSGPTIYGEKPSQIFIPADETTKTLLIPNRTNLETKAIYGLFSGYERKTPK